MKLNFISIICFVFIYSCSSKDRIILIDEYYTTFNFNSGNKYIHKVNLNEFNAEVFFEYKKILISPLLYKLYLDEWIKFTGNLYVFEYLAEKNSENHKSIFIDDSDSYNSFAHYIDNDVMQKYKKISILIDYDTELKKDDVQILKTIKNNIDLNFLLITRNVSRTQISNFIKNNKNSDLWVIDSDKYGLYGYDLITEGSILLYNGENSKNGNSNIKFSIEVDLASSFDKIFNDEIDFIFSELKKY